MSRKSVKEVMKIVNHVRTWRPEDTVEIKDPVAYTKNVRKINRLYLKPKQEGKIVYWCPLWNGYMQKKCIGYNQIDCVKLSKECNKKFKLIPVGKK